MKCIGNDWDKVLEEEFKKDYFKKLIENINIQYNSNTCYPAKENIFRALQTTSYKDVKVVILGQDPYHGENEANGLSFSVNKGIKIPPSLSNIFKELYNDLGIKRTNTDLTDWANQGVLLLNAILSVEKDKPLSHKNYGWERFTDTIIKKLSEREDKVIFILWGNYARSKKELINKRHYIIESAHPSPLSASRGFFGTKPFSKVNELLIKEGKETIKWQEVNTIEKLETPYKEIENLSLKENDNIVVAVSGGPDSMALLHLLIRNREKNKFNIICAHVDHNVRKESKSELLFVKDYCEKNKVIFESMTIEQKIDHDFENEARKIRYNFFNKLIKQYNAKYLFTAHHGDDLIETILMRIVRGSNIQGYAGFKKITELDNYSIVKPLISVTKQEIINYNTTNNIKWVEDKTNKEDIHTRNRYRNYILPQLKKENQNVNLKFLKYSENIIECIDYIDSQVDLIFDKIYVDNKINLKAFQEQPDFIKKNILYRILKIIYQNEIHNINDKHIESLIEISKKTGYKEISLPLNIKAIKNYNYIYLVSHLDKEEYNYVLNKKIKLPNGFIIEEQDEVLDNSNYTCLLNSKEIELPIIVRTKKEGERIEVKNLNGSKKISDIFVSEKVDKDKRQLWPIVTDSRNRIIWIPGIKKSKYCKQKEENYDIILRYY